MKPVSLEQKALMRSVGECYPDLLRALLTVMLAPPMSDGAPQRPNLARCMPIAMGTILATRYPGDDAAALAQSLFQAAFSPMADTHPDVLEIWERVQAMLAAQLKGGAV